MSDRMRVTAVTVEIRTAPELVKLLKRRRVNGNALAERIEEILSEELGEGIWAARVELERCGP